MSASPQTTTSGTFRTSYSAKHDRDTASMTAILLEPLSNLQSLSQTLFLSLSPAQSKPPPPPPTSTFLDCDAALAAALQLVHVHQIKQRKIELLKNEILDLEARWREICSELEKGKNELENIITEGKERISAINQAKQGTFTSLVFKRYDSRNLTLQRPFPTRNSLHMLKASVHSPLHRPTCPTSHYLVSFRHPRCSSLLFPTRRRCVAVTSTQRRHLDCLVKRILLADVRVVLAPLVRNVIDAITLHTQPQRFPPNCPTHHSTLAPEPTRIDQTLACNNYNSLISI